MKIHLALISIVFLAFACSRTPEKNLNFLKDEGLNKNEKLERLLTSDLLTKEGFSAQDIAFLNEFYSDRDYESVCTKNDSTLSKTGVQIEKIVASSLAYGIPNYRLKSYPNRELHPIEKEAFIILNASRILKDVKDGFFNYKEHNEKPRTAAGKEILQDFIDKKSLQNKEDFLIKQCTSKDTLYLDLSNSIFQFFHNYKLDSIDFTKKEIKEFKKDSKTFAIRSLRDKGYLDTESYTDENYKLALLKFKAHNGLEDNEDLSDYTLEALSESNLHKLNRAAISLDKIRQRPNRGPKYIRINIPEYNLYFYANDSLKAIHKVVVGKRDTRTPLLESEIRLMIAFPYWKVPPKIIKDEIMPDVYKNPSYLAKHRYKLCKHNDTSAINPNSINWKNKPSGFNIIQLPGPGNSLGIMKFEFLNEFNVYVHDTPQKGFFKRYVRSYSHGCMRCENPVDLARMMIFYDQEDRKKKSFTCDTLDSIMARGKHHNIRLIKRIPIYVEYQSVVSIKNRPIFHIDIYYKDDDIIQVLKKNQQKESKAK